ncbi:molybdopterin-dependent oxidoreductase [Xylophilus sp. GOD-11R]|uniref:molybdopterin-dependent oxidoreductase n=1 Tax=Xylophilus sp. GOD-11R TaxID=3089814 RepID=UPI00298BCAC9|nr:molybdopterin-dependent oxidoreductase [Xylophilus sp. GOD-11R]WPB56665.1 molybdopterin-dependent oxidoreductase [Xylophilus sp. GOD-11R]
MSEIRTPGFCALCKSRCGSVMVTRDGEFIGQEPDPSHPTGVALCVKGRAAAEIVYRPSRQLHPLRRTRPKGDPDPGWVRIGWDEALDRTAEALDRLRRENGAESVAFGWTTPSGTPFSDDLRWVERFTNAFGSPNVAYGVEVCNWHKDHAHAYTVGRSIASPDFANTGCVVLWGHNPSAAWLDHATATGAAMKRGARLIVVDPRRAGFAARADQWLRVRPGADGALALGIAHQMLRHGWFDQGFVRRWSNGPLLVRTDTGRFLRAAELWGDDSGDAQDLVAWSEADQPLRYRRASRTFADANPPVLRASPSLTLADGSAVHCETAFIGYERLCADYPPERVEQLCWVGREQLEQTARLLHESGPVSYYAWSGIGQHTNATQTDRALAILMALTGSIDAPGGNVVFGKPPANDVSAAAMLDAEQRDKCIELERSALGPGRHGWIGADTMYRAMIEHQPYRLRGLVNFGRNFLVNHANAARGAQALAGLDFMVHADVVMNPTAAHADIFLPINTPWERESLRVGFEGSAAAEQHIQLRQAAIAPRGESRSDGFVVFELARRLGLGHLFWDGDIEAGLAHVLAPTGLDLATLRARPGGVHYPAPTRWRAYEQHGFATATGLVEIYSEVFHAQGQPPLPVFREPAASPIGTARADFPLVLTSAKLVQFCHGQHRDIASLRRRAPHPEVSLHPDAAAARGIAEGEDVELCTPHGTARLRARFDRSLDARVVCAQYGWWQGNEGLGLPASDAMADRGANLNRVIGDAEADPVSGSIGLRSGLCEIRPLPGAGTSSRAWSGWREFRIDATTAETADVMSFTLIPRDGSPLPAYRGGQHVTLRLDRPDAAPLVRCYSLSGPSHERAWRISVKRAGAMSGALHALGGGLDRTVWLQAPAGRFHPSVERPDAPLLLVGAGIGITPLLAMLHDCRQRASTRPIVLFHGVRSAGDHAFREEIEALRDGLPQLRVLSFHSAPAPGEAAARPGRIPVEDVARAWTPGAEVYLCGPGEMVAAMSAGLTQAGVPASALHHEAFGPSSLPAADRALEPRAIAFAISGGGMTWTPGQGSLLDQLAAAGRAGASGCRAGQCESCIISLAEGRVAHPEGSAPVDEQHCLPCVCIPLTPLVLNL